MRETHVANYIDFCDRKGFEKHLFCERLNETADICLFCDAPGDHTIKARAIFSGKHNAPGGSTTFPACVLCQEKLGVAGDHSMVVRNSFQEAAFMACVLEQC